MQIAYSPKQLKILQSDYITKKGKKQMADLKLYEIADSFIALMDKLESGELTEEAGQVIQQELENALMVKSNNIIGYYLDRKSLIDAIDVQIKRLQEYKKAETNKLDRYKDYVKSSMEVLGIEKIETGAGKLQIAKSPISVDIIDERLIPDEYKEVITETKVNKKKIADNFKTTGEIIEGVRINTDNTNLRIK